ncbi:hypothetical protein [Brachyspira hampsonii]|nr:hypothetical protein [Brachyspira hampsonii]
MGKTSLNDIIKVKQRINSKCSQNIESLDLNKELEISTDSRDNFVQL